jgi:hypothetical protein
MSRESPARRVVFACCALLCAASSTRALADDAATGAGIPPLRARASSSHRIVLFASGPHAQAWARALARQWGELEEDPVTVAAALPAGIARARMDALARIEGLLLDARVQAASLREADALTSLAAAERAAEGAADVPGIAAWMAEVQLQLGAVAAQAGALELSEAAFRRAATLEPGRQLLPAEAAPDVVARCARIHAELAASPAGAFEVRAAPAPARVFLDDVELGAAPVRARAVVGRHVLRVEASGHDDYGAFIDGLPGERPALAVQLTPLPELERARALQQAVQGGTVTRVPAVLNAFCGPAPARRGDGCSRVGRSDLDAVAVVETADSGTRALIVRCDRSGCRAPIRALREQPIALGSGVLNDEQLIAARAWLSAPRARPTSDQNTPLWGRWYLWGGTALAVAAGALAVGFAAQPAPEHRLRVEVDPGAL